MSPGFAAATKFKDFEKKASWFSQLDEMVSGSPGSAPEQGDAVADEGTTLSSNEGPSGQLSAAALKAMYERLESASPGPLGRTRASEVISTSRRSSFANSDDNASGAEDDGENNLGSPLARRTGDGATALVSSKLHRNSATRRKTSLSTELKKKAQTLGSRAARLTARAFNGNNGGGSEGRPSLSAMDGDEQLDETEAVPTLRRDSESRPLSGSLGPDLFQERRYGGERPHSIFCHVFFCAWSAVVFVPIFHCARIYIGRLLMPACGMSWPAILHLEASLCCSTHRAAV
jgi:hypothetical protein